LGTRPSSSNTKVRGFTSSLTTDMMFSEIVGWAKRSVPHHPE
jgi:hypothetical protein